MPLVVGHAIHRHSAIARPVEPKVPTNLAVLVLMGLAVLTLFVVAMAWGAAPGDAFAGGLRGALLIFATWALTRDLAPDDDAAAFAALVPLGVAVVIGASPKILEPMIVLGFVRVVNRSVGPPAKVIDRLVLLMLVVVVAREGSGFFVGIAAVIAFALDGLLSDRHPQGMGYAGLAAIATIIGMAVGEPFIVVATPGPWTIGAAVVALVFVVVAIRQPPPQSCCDTDPDVLIARDRVQGGMLVALVPLLGSLIGGDPHVQGWVVGWAALLGVIALRPLSGRQPAA